MKIALIGPAGTGKTTTAHYFVQKYPEYEFVNLSTQQLMDKYGYKNHQDVVRDQEKNGIKFQEELIKARSGYMTDMTFRESLLITDRTPFDSYVYYLIHNSFWAYTSLSKELENIALISLLRFNRIVLFPANSIKPK